MKTVNASREAAALARVQERKADAYVQLIEVSERIGLWAQTVNPVTTPPLRKPGKLPKVGEQSAARARLLAFGSLEVRRLWDAWQGDVQAVQNADTRIQLAERTIGQLPDVDNPRIAETRLSSHDRLSKVRDALDMANPGEVTLREAEQVSRAALHERMNQELAGGGLNRGEPLPARWTAFY